MTIIDGDLYNDHGTTKMLLTTITGELPVTGEFAIVAHGQRLLKWEGIDKLTASQIIRKERPDIHVDLRYWMHSDRQRQVRR